MYKKYFKRIHLSWLLASLSLGILAGIVISANFPEYRASSVNILFLYVVFVLISILKRNKIAIILAICAGLLIGIYRGTIYQAQISRYERLHNQYVTLTGHVSSDAETGEKGGTSFQVSGVRIENNQLIGKIWVKSSSYEANNIKRGDIVTLSGVIDEGFGTFPASMPRANLKELVRPSPGDIGRRVRDWFSENSKKVIPEPQASLGVSYVTGQRQSLSDDLENELRMLGLVHLVVASGFHLSLVVKYVRRPLSRRSKYLAALATVFVIGGFLAISGFSTSMVRAAWVTGLSLLAWYYGRSVHPVILLLFVAALTVLFNPSFILGDVGWYLSFAAFGGVIILAPLIHRYFWGKDKPGKIRDLVIATIAAQITTFPIIAYVFGQFSPLALLSNVLIQPLVSITMLLVFLSGIIFPLLPFAAGIFGWLANLPLVYMTTVTKFFSSLPIAQGEINISISLVIISYLLIILLVFFLWRKTGFNLRKENIVE